MDMMTATDRLRLRWRLALDGLNVHSSTSFLDCNPATGRTYSVGIPDSGPLSVVCDYMPMHTVWVGSLSRPFPLVMWDGDYKNDNEVWFDEVEFRAAARAAKAWMDEERPADDFVSPPGLRA